MKDLKPATYKISKFCMEPTAFKVKEESQFANKEAEFVKTKLMTRLTYTLDEVHVPSHLVAIPPVAFCSWQLKLNNLGLLQMSGTFKVDSGGKVEFQEEDGIDYAPVTVQLPGGERVPFLFTVKELNAKGTLDGFGGDFTVPSYRGSSFLDPKVCRLALALRSARLDVKDRTCLMLSFASLDSLSVCLCILVCKVDQQLFRSAFA